MVIKPKSPKRGVFLRAEEADVDGQESDCVWYINMGMIVSILKDSASIYHIYVKEEAECIQTKRIEGLEDLIINEELQETPKTVE